MRECESERVMRRATERKGGREEMREKGGKQRDSLPSPCLYSFRQISHESRAVFAENKPQR